MPSCTDNSSPISAFALCAVRQFPAVWQLRSFAVAPFGISRRLAFRAVWHFAPFGISRRLAFHAVWHFTPFGISRRLAFRAIWHFAPLGISRSLAVCTVWQLAQGRGRYPNERKTCRQRGQISPSPGTIFRLK